MTATQVRPSAPPQRARAARPAWNTDVRRTLLAALAVALGMLTLNGLIRDHGWIVDAVLTICVVIAPAAVLRVWRRPGAFDVWIGVVLLVPWLTLRFVPDHAAFGLIPSAGTVDDISRLMTDLHHTTSTEVAPVQSTPAIRLVVCALIGLLVALVDLIAVVGRRCALAGIPLLVVYTVSGAVARHAVPWAWFALAAVGFLLLLTLDTPDARASWGHRVRTATAAGPAGGALRWPRTATALGAVAIAVAVLVPLVVPLPTDNLLADALRGRKGPGLGQFGAGTGQGGSIRPFANLKDNLRQGDPVQVMSVTVDGPRRSAAGGPAVPFYLRSNVLSEFTPQGWRAASHGSEEDIRTSQLEIGPRDDRPNADKFEARITVQGLADNPPVFARLTEVRNVNRGSTWSAQDQLILGEAVPRGTQIVEDFEQPAPTVGELRQAPSAADDPQLAPWLTKPQVQSSVTDLTDSIIAERKATTAYDKAFAINSYFTDGKHGFVYSLDTKDGDSGSELVDFLTNKQGFCQQYAAAEAVMFREAGLPSRVVLGYMHSPPDSQGRFTVDSHDAHAWVETYFEGIGWIPFDPTPSAGISSGSANILPWAMHADTGAASDPTAPRGSTTAPSTSVSTSSGPATAPTGESPAAVTPTGDGGGTDWTVPLAVAAGVIALALLLGTPAGVRARRRRRRWAAARDGDIDALWHELADTAVDLGYGWSSARSPRQVARWLGRDAGDGGEAFDALAGLVERQRYGRGVAGTEHADGVLERVRAALAGLQAASGRRTRVLARLWPASLSGPSRPAGRRH